MSKLEIQLIIHNKYAQNIAETLLDRIVDILGKVGIAVHLTRYDHKTIFNQRFLLEAIHLDEPADLPMQDSEIDDPRKFYFCYSKKLDKLVETEKKYGTRMFYYAEDFNTYINQLQILTRIGESIDYLNIGLSDSLTDSKRLRKNKMLQELKKLERELLHGGHFGSLMEKKLRLIESGIPQAIEDKFSEMIVDLLSLSKTLHPEIRMESGIKTLKKLLAELLISDLPKPKLEMPETGNKKIDLYVRLFNDILKS